MSQKFDIPCPKCGNREVYVHDKKRFGWKRGCALGCFFWPLALLGFTKSAKIEKVCMSCNHKF